MLRGRRIDRALLRRVGRPCTWEKGVLCPNLKEDGQHPYTCPYCAGGRGYLYKDPQELQILFTSDARREDFDLAGAWERGECTATVGAHVPIGDQDRIIIEDDPIRDTEHVTRGAGGSDILRFPYVEELVFVQGVSSTYTIGTDCSLSVASDGTSSIVWSGSNVPTAGDNYAVIAMLKPVWIVQGHPMVRAFGKAKSNQLPLRVKLGRFDKAVPREG